MRHTFLLMNAVYFQSIFWSEKFMIVGDGCESTFYQKVESFILFRQVSGITPSEVVSDISLHFCRSNLVPLSLVPLF